MSGTVRIITWEKKDFHQDPVTGEWDSAETIKEICEFHAGGMRLKNGNYSAEIQRAINKAVEDCHFEGNKITIEPVPSRWGQLGVRYHTEEPE